MQRTAEELELIRREIFAAVSFLKKVKLFELKKMQ